MWDDNTTADVKGTCFVFRINFHYNRGRAEFLETLMWLYCYGACRASRVLIAVVWGGLSVVWHKLEM
jgi:hypothetical protein